MARVSERAHHTLDSIWLLNEGDDSHLCLTLGALKRVDLINSLHTGAAHHP